MGQFLIINKVIINTKIIHYIELDHELFRVRVVTTLDKGFKASVDTKEEYDKLLDNITKQLEIE